MPTRPHAERSASARRFVFGKGIFDIALCLSIVFAPQVLYDGILNEQLTELTHNDLVTFSSSKDPQVAFALASFIFASAIASISASRQASEEGYKVVASLNGAYAFAGIVGSFLTPQLGRLGSTFLLITGMLNFVSFLLITGAGDYEYPDLFSRPMAVKPKGEKEKTT